MKNTIFIKSLIFINLTLFTLLPSFAQEVSTLSDVSYNFDEQKMTVVINSFHFARSFVDYFYELIAKNTSQLYIAQGLSAHSGWCVGDAHAENFGILLQENGTGTFTMNDMDDFGPCPLAYDFFRFTVTSRLAFPNLNIVKIKNSYLQGLSQGTMTPPQAIISLYNQSLTLGQKMDPKNLDGNKLKRKKSMAEVTSSIKQIIISDLESQLALTLSKDELKVKDIVSFVKVGGGSGGLLRYEVLCQNSKNEYIHMELKELATPSIYPVATSIIPNPADRMSKALELEQGSTHSHYYNVFLIGQKEMLLRPKFAGNLGITLTSFSDSDNEAILNYEAFILGRIHASSADSTYKDALEKFDENYFESDLNKFTKFISAKYLAIKK